MTDLNRTARRWAALAALAPLPLLWPAPGVAQAPAPAPATSPTTAAERAQRDAERVFEFIKFHTLRPARTIEPARPARPPAPAPAPAAPTAASTERTGTPTRSAPPAPTDTPARPTASLPASEPPARPTPGLPASEVPSKPAANLPASEPPPTLQAAPIKAPEPTALPAAPSTPPPTAAPDPEDDDAEDGALQLQTFVAPVLTPAVQATLGAGARNVKVRFRVEADGRVSQAEAAPGVPKRLARPATDAILQWRFAPLPQPRTVDVEIAFRRD